MFRLKSLLVLGLVLFVAGCYQSETVIELNPDGSGMLTFNGNFDRATEEQRQQLIAFLKQPNTSSQFNREELEKSFVKPHFEIIEHVEDKENLKFKAVIKFNDINRLLTVDNGIALKGIDFTVESDALNFKLTRTVEDIKKLTLGGLSQTNETNGVREKFRFVNAQTGTSTEFSHQYKAEDEANDLVWQGRLEFPGHHIKREVVKYNLADYPELPSVEAKIVEAEWVRIKSKFNRPSYLNLKLSVPRPETAGFTYLGWDETYLVAGRYSDGSEIDIIEPLGGKRHTNFSDNNVSSGRTFNLPLELTFPKSPVDKLKQTELRLRVSRSPKINRIDLGPILPNHEYKTSSLILKTKDLDGKPLSIDYKGPVVQIKDFLVKTKRGNIFVLEKGSWSGQTDSGFMSFRDFLPLSELTLLVDIYEPMEYVWFNIKIPEFDLTPRGKSGQRDGNWELAIEKIVPGVLDRLPEISGGVYDSKESVAQYWAGLSEAELVPALVQMTADIEQFKSNFKVYSWYQTGLAEELKKRSAFYKTNREKIANILFTLYKDLPNQNDNAAIAYLIANADLDELIRDKVLKAVRKGKLQKNISRFLQGKLSAEERGVIEAKFRESRNWIQAQELLELLTRGSDGDMDLAQRVLNDSTRESFVRGAALKAVLNAREEFPALFLKSYVLDSKLRQQTVQLINNKLRDLTRRVEKNYLSLEEYQRMTSPLISVFEDLAETKDEWKAKEAGKIIHMLRTGKRK